MKKTEKKTPDSAAGIADALAQMQKFGFQSMNWMGADWAEKMSDIGSEALHFLSERVQEDVALQHKLLHCKDLKEMQHLQAEFLQTAIARYTEETGKMISLGTELMSAGKPKD